MKRAALVIVAVLGCGGGGMPQPGAFRIVASEEDGALLSAFVASDGTAYFAGGVLEGAQATLLRWDGQALSRIATGDAHAFWWIHGVGDHEMYLAGEHGELHRFDGTTLERIDAGAPADATLFGVWGKSGDDLWTVGGSFVTGGPRRVILRNAGGAWAPVASPDGIDEGITYFKVWGSSAGDVWIVGDQGIVLRDRGAGLAREGAPGAERYVTVHGCGPDDVYIVGGGATAAAAHFDGTAWTAPSLVDVPVLAGVACAGAADAYVGGYFAYAARLTAAGAATPITMPPDLADLAIHGLAVGGGRVVAAGGDLVPVAGQSQRGFAVVLESTAR